MSEATHSIIAPDLDLGGVPVVVSLWHVRQGARVSKDARLLELHAGDVVVDLLAPESGVLAQRLVTEEDPVQPGQLLGWIEPEP